MSRSIAYQQFLDSVPLNYERWHDGESMNLEALSQVTAAERAEICTRLCAGPVTWRELEALAAIDLPMAWQTIENAFEKSTDPDTRLAAAEILHKAGRLPGIDRVIARELRAVGIGTGLTRALLLAEEHPTDAVKRGLFESAIAGTEASIHSAALLCMLCGLTDDPFDWNMRPFFLRFAPGNEETDRRAAIEELRQKTAL